MEEAPRLDPESERARLFDSIGAFLRNAAEQRPLVIFFDDLHWRDKPSLALPEVIARDPDARRTPGSASIVTSEDEANDTVIPRLKYQRARLSRVRIVPMSEFMGPDAVDRLEHVIRERQRKYPDGPMLVSIEPLNEFLAKHEMRDDADVRRSLQPLRNMAKDTGASIIGLMHLNKRSAEPNVMYRLLNSVAYVNLARYVLVAGYDPTDPEPDPNDRRRLLAVAKGNLSRPAPTLVYYMRDPEPGRLEWTGDASKVESEQMLQQSDKTSKTPQMDAAIAMLQEELADGPVTEELIRTEAVALDIGWRTVQTAKKTLGIRSQKHPEEGYWELVLPGKAAK